jgi:hypothetical protein
MRNTYRVLAEKYEVIEARNNRKVDFIQDVTVNGAMYTVDAGFMWEDQAIGHKASIGHYGVEGKDIYKHMPVAIEWIEIVDDNGVVTDPETVQAVSDHVLEIARSEAAEA